MTEANLIEARLDAATFFLNLFSVFFAIVSAYIGGLYFFLNRAPFPIRVLAFFILTVSFAFLSGLSLATSSVSELIVARWQDQDLSVVGAEAFWVPMVEELGGFGLFHASALIGWGATMAVYLALFYLTFGYSWPTGNQQHDRTEPTTGTAPG